MSVYAGPEISQSNLVFAYDMGNTDKSWKGAPATNLITNPTNEVIATVNEFAIFADISPIFDTYGEGVYSISADIKSEVPGDITVYTASGAVEYNIGYYTAACETYYKRFYFNNINVTRTDPAVTYSNLSFYGGYGTGKKPSIKNVQIEKNAFCTPFVVGTRSNTQSVIDQTRINTITANSLTYASNNTFSFNGTTNYMWCTNNCGLTSSITLNAWVKSLYTGSGPHKTVVCTDISYQYGAKMMVYKNTTRFGLWLGFGSTNYEAFTNIDVNDNTNKMLTATWNNTTGEVKLYVNGNIVATIASGQTSLLALNDGRICVGADYYSLGTSGFGGNIYNAQIYNRVLLPEEIKQNFNALRGRFGL